MENRSKIKEEYDRSIPEKIKELEKLIERVKTHQQVEALKDLHYFVHKLAGNAGVYGYSQVSDTCKELQSKIDPLIHCFSPDEIHTLSLEVFLNEIKTGFNHVSG